MNRRVFPCLVPPTSLVVLNVIFVSNLTKHFLCRRSCLESPAEIYVSKLMFWSHCAGESLQDERVQGGAFVSPDGVQMPYKHVPVRNQLVNFHTMMMDKMHCIWCCQISSLGFPVFVLSEAVLSSQQISYSQENHQTCRWPLAVSFGKEEIFFASC